MIMLIHNNDGYSIVAGVAGLKSVNLLVITQFWHMAPLASL